MKITDLKTFLFCPPPTQQKWVMQKNFLFVKIETDEGISGWGESLTLKDREKSIAQHLSDIGPYLVGSNPFHIKRFLQMMYENYAEKRMGVELLCAVSGIEQALWDIVGKAFKTSVYNLLGGPCRNKIRVYANGWSRGATTPQEMAKRAEDVVALGFDAIKVYPFLNNEDEKTGIENVRAVRSAVGLDIDILIDVWRRPSPSQAIRVGRRLEEFNVFWCEEPVPSENLDALAAVRRAITTPVVTGECLYTKFEFRQVLEKQAADILNPDVGSCGGILELKEVAAMAEPYYVVISPHNFNSTAIGLAATLQASAVMPNFLIAEYFVNFTESGDAVSINPLRVDHGFIDLPTTPGLGVEIDEGILKSNPSKKFPRRVYAETV